MRENIGFALMCFGVIFDAVGCVGLIRLPDLYNRLQASLKCVAMGTSLILLGTMVIAGLSPLSAKAFLCLLFILIISPTTEHALARASYIGGVKLWKKSIVDKFKEDIDKS
ncbi:MAG TPA: monovalent cation/H(+) antiporter subunit G [Candidatus Ratteibacteria bacterium]|jgi:multicomponent Na+:H+ antiporter subunit G|nr:monovalent cation/H(+) antiporter subunit G [bacterium]HON04805.1 monovalent cation/H(+) antiporter subunit G [bacterium]HOQ81722.1 monovalent cation/H(+) antiporter subunit G [bacterium]HPC30290.1 monovalent cation/H(+) antiporter subunit G [bacterium]HRS05735.1 monovalent cation/H(+) antiporter subunit G [Candidatus Ratteibacteria bacterium]